MCQHCGCREIPAIARLSAEHEDIRTYAHDAMQLAGLGDRAGSLRMLHRMQELLVPHTRVEESALFPAMAVEYPEHVTSLQHDHRRIAESLQWLIDSEESENWLRKLRTALTQLFEHILREEDGLFPAALAVLSPAQWEDLEAVRRQVVSRGQI